MVHDAADVPAGPVNLDSVRVAFNEERLVSDAGLLVCATLADRLGVEELVNESVGLDRRAPGACLPGRKVMSLVHGMLAGGDSIDDMNVLRAGSTGLVLGHRVMAPAWSYATEPVLTRDFRHRDPIAHHRGGHKTAAPLTLRLCPHAVGGQSRVSWAVRGRCASNPRSFVSAQTRGPYRAIRFAEPDFEAFRG
jgi:hypothetical protein